MPASPYFTAATFKFLRDLANNNNREWFADNKERFEEKLREPALTFIRDFESYLHKVSPHFRADARKSGGSMFRIYRDVRFSKDKSPYKTHTGIQFRHELGKDAHCPGFYLHLQPGELFAGVGIWRPDTATTNQIRGALLADPERWKRATSGRFSRTFELAGEQLKRAPRGIDPEHPLVDDLKRKDFIGVGRLTEKSVTSPDFIKQFATLCRVGGPMIGFLCDALDVPF